MTARPVLVIACAVLAGGAAWFGYQQGWFHRAAHGATTTPQRDRAVPVEIAPVEHGRLVERRTISGTLLPRSQFTVAAKVAGRIEALHVDLGDEVQEGDVIAVLDDDEFEQAVAEARAALDVARAEAARAASARTVARRNFERVTGLQQIEIASSSELDVAVADLDAREAEVEVATAKVARAAAVLAAAEVRRGYATVRATWSAADADSTGDRRIVAARFLDAGATVAANAPLVTVVDISSVRAVLHVTERDFARLAVGQSAVVKSDAWPGRSFTGRIERLAPVFEEASRQMRVEVGIDNAERELRPGMFVRVAIELDAADDATIVPEVALVTRGDGQGLFAVRADDTVQFVAVETGIAAGGRVQVFGDGITDRVVTLGQQLCRDGARVRVPTAGDAEPR